MTSIGKENRSSQCLSYKEQRDRETERDRDRDRQRSHAHGVTTLSISCQDDVIVPDDGVLYDVNLMFVGVGEGEGREPQNSPVPIVKGNPRAV